MKLGRSVSAVVSEVSARCSRGFRVSPQGKLCGSALLLQRGKFWQRPSEKNRGRGGRTPGCCTHQSGGRVSSIPGESNHRGPSVSRCREATDTHTLLVSGCLPELLVWGRVQVLAFIIKLMKERVKSVQLEDAAFVFYCRCVCSFILWA